MSTTLQLTTTEQDESKKSGLALGTCYMSTA